MHVNAKWIQSELVHNSHNFDWSTNVGLLAGYIERILKNIRIFPTLKVQHMHLQSLEIENHRRDTNHVPFCTYKIVEIQNIYLYGGTS